LAEMPVTVLDLSVSFYSSQKSTGITKIGDVLDLREKVETEFISNHNFDAESLTVR